jgi:hypothetical protein
MPRHAIQGEPDIAEIFWQKLYILAHILGIFGDIGTFGDMGTEKKISFKNEKCVGVKNDVILLKVFSIL